MKPRRAPYGTKNISGANIDLASQMQTLGVDIDPSSLSKLEGQQRIATDIELRAIAKIFNLKIDDLVPPYDGE